MFNMKIVQNFFGCLFLFLTFSLLSSGISFSQDYDDCYNYGYNFGYNNGDCRPANGSQDDFQKNECDIPFEGVWNEGCNAGVERRNAEETSQETGECRLECVAYETKWFSGDGRHNCCEGGIWRCGGDRPPKCESTRNCTQQQMICD